MTYRQTEQVLLLKSGWRSRKVKDRLCPPLVDSFASTFTLRDYGLHSFQIPVRCAERICMFYRFYSLSVLACLISYCINTCFLNLLEHLVKGKNGQRLWLVGYDPRCVILSKFLGEMPLAMSFNVFQCVSASVNPVFSSSTIMFHELRVHQPTLCVLMLLC